MLSSQRKAPVTLPKLMQSRFNRLLSRLETADLVVFRIFKKLEFGYLMYKPKHMRAKANEHEREREKEKKKKEKEV